MSERVSGQWAVTTDVVLKEDGVESRVKWECAGVSVFMSTRQARELAADLLAQAEDIEPSRSDEDDHPWAPLLLWVLVFCVILGGFIDGSAL